MKRAWWLLGALVVLVGVFMVASGGHPARALIGAVSGVDALDYLPPRREVPLTPGPPQPTLSLAEAGIDVATQ